MDMEMLTQATSKLEAYKRLIGEDRLMIMGAYLLTITVNKPTKDSDAILDFAIGQPIRNAEEG